MVEEEEKDEEELEEDTLKLELELGEREELGRIVEEGEGGCEVDELELEVGGWGTQDGQRHVEKA